MTTNNDNINASFQEFLGVEDEVDEIQPFNPEEISIDKKLITMDAILRRLEQGTIILSPDFQRNFVWDEVKKSRLIESLMLKIPIPMFYVASDEAGTFTVVDGLQRLSTIRDYILGNNKPPMIKGKLIGEGFRLSGLEFWSEKYEDFMFKDLPINIQNRILETEFTFTIINPGTPEDVKRNVFKRINTGGEPLTPQEIRHALYGGSSTKLLLELSKDESFLEATGNSVKPLRMLDRELILRFISFYIRDFTNYPKSNDMDAFLSDTMRIINGFPSLTSKDLKKILPDDNAKSKILIKDVDIIKETFIKTMIRAFQVFNEHTFRRSIGISRRTPINKSLFEVWSVLLANLSEDEFVHLMNNKNEFLVEYSKLLDTDSFINSISQDSWKYSGVTYRFTTLSKLIKSYI